MTRLVDAAVLADLLGVTRSYVYEHADELGAIPLGTGPKPRLRFNPDVALERLSACSASRTSEAPEPTRRSQTRSRRRAPMGTTVELLPIRGR
jgi:hypothetical protein